MTRDAATARWLDFLQALADEVDGLGGAGARDALLRGVGTRMAARHALPPARDLTSLQGFVNVTLANWGWGEVRFIFDPAAEALVIAHVGLPALGRSGTPPGTWLSAVLEGLYEGWLGALPGGVPGLVATRDAVTAECVMLRYWRPG